MNRVQNNLHHVRTVKGRETQLKVFWSKETERQQEIGDEFHYVLQCPNFVTDRKYLIPKYFFNRPSTLKLSSLFNKKKPETIRKLCQLIDIINKKISSP